jgi:hypothetical protein
VAVHIADFLLAVGTSVYFQTMSLTIPVTSGAPYSLASWTAVINRKHHHSFLDLSVVFNFSLNQSFQEDLFAGYRACNPSPHFVGTAKTGKFQRNTV